MSTDFLKYFKNTSWLLFERIFRMALVLFVSIYVARYLGPSDYGILSYSISFVAIFMAIATLGLDSIIVRELVGNSIKKQDIMGTTFFLKIIGTLIMWLLVGLSLMFIENDSLTKNIIGIIALSSIFHAFNVIDYNFQAEVKSKYVVYTLLFQLIISSLAKLMVIYMQLPLIWFAYIHLIDGLIIALGLCISYLWNNNKISSWAWKSDLALQLVKESWPLILSGIAVTMYMRIDQIMIKQMLENKDVGVYSVAVQLSEAWYFIPMAITASLFPAIIKAKKQGEEFYHKQLKRLYSLMIWIAILIAIPTTFIAPWLITLLYGEVYSEAAHVLSINIWAGVFVFIGVASGKWLINEKMQMFTLYRTLLGLTTNILLNLLLIDIYGIYGAAIATLASQFIASYFFDLLHARTRVSFFLKSSALLYPFSIIVKRTHLTH